MSQDRVILDKTHQVALNDTHHSITNIVLKMEERVLGITVCTNKINNYIKGLPEIIQSTVGATHDNTTEEKDRLENKSAFSLHKN